MAAWIEKRINLARKLYEGECGGSYSDAVLILVSVVSGIASRTWTGNGKDRARFVETLVRFCPEELNLTRVSVPLLVQALEQKKDEKSRTSADCICSAFYSCCSSQVITGNEIDKSENAIQQVAQNLTTREVRACSYANLLYREVRSGLVHEYRVTDQVSIYPMAASGSEVSYVNTANLSSGKVSRGIHFEYDWLEKVVKRLHNSLDLIWQNGSQQDPAPWWIEDK